MLVIYRVNSFFFFFLALNKVPVSHSHTCNVPNLLYQGHMPGGQGHMLPGQGHTEPVSQPQTPQPIMSVTPPPNSSHPSGKLKLLYKGLVDG